MNVKWIAVGLVTVGAVVLINNRRKRRTLQTQLALTDRLAYPDDSLLLSGGAPVHPLPQQERTARLLKQKEKAPAVGNYVLVWLVVALLFSCCVAAATFSRESLTLLLKSFDQWFLTISILLFTGLIILVQGSIANHTSGNSEQPGSLSLVPDESPQPPPAALTPAQDLTGVWLKDFKSSQTMDDALEAMKLNAIMRAAVRLIRGLEIKMTDAYFELSMLTPFAWFKVTERYPLSGDTVSYKRRDLRRGHHRGAVRVTAHGGVALMLEWDEPFAGREIDIFHMPRPGVLYVDTTMHMATGKTMTYRTVHSLRQ